MRAVMFGLVAGVLGACAPGVVEQKTSSPTVDFGSQLDVEGESDEDTTDSPAADAGDSASTEEDDESEAVVEYKAPVLDSISPRDGTTAGGQMVVLRGEFLDTIETVSICGQPAIVESVDAEHVTAWTPEGTAGTCDVQVSTAGGEGALMESFTYWPDAEGLTVAAVSWTSAIYANPNHWAEPPTNELRAHLAVVPAQELELTELYTRDMDTCIRTDGETREDGWADWGGQQVGEAVVHLDDEELPLTFEPNIDAYTETIELAGSTSIATPVGAAFSESELSPALDLVSGAVTPQSFEVVTPDLHASAVPTADADAFDVAWTGGSADFVGIDLWDLQSDRRIRCLAYDDGRFTVPASLLRDFGSTWTQLLVTRYETDAVPTTHNRGLVQVQAGYGVIGPVYLSR